MKTGQLGRWLRYSSAANVNQVVLRGHHVKTPTECCAPYRPPCRWNRCGRDSGDRGARCRNHVDNVSGHVPRSSECVLRSFVRRKACYGASFGSFGRGARSSLRHRRGSISRPTPRVTFLPPRSRAGMLLTRPPESDSRFTAPSATRWNTISHCGSPRYEHCSPPGAHRPSIVRASSKRWLHHEHRHRRPGSTTCVGTRSIVLELIDITGGEFERLRQCGL